jgi:heat shock protein HslJ
MRLLTVFFVLFLASCAPKNVQKGALLTPFSSLSWTSLLGQPFELSTPTAGRRPTIQFQEGGVVSGTGGVNRYSTAAEIDGKGGITWKGEIAATKMAAAPEAMAAEDAFFDALRGAKKISLTGGTLRLEGAKTLEFTRQK